MNDIKLLKAKEASQILRVPLSTLYRLTKAGKIKGFKIGKQWRYRKEDILIYFNAGVNFSQPIAERRKYPRINCRITCLFRIFIPDEKDIQSKGTIRNLSAGGVLLEAPEGPADLINEQDPLEVEFTLQLNDEYMLVKSQARVVRSEGRQLGIRFKELPEGVRDRVMDYVGE